VRPVVRVCAVVVAVGALAACGSSSSSSGSGASSKPASTPSSSAGTTGDGPTITAKDYSFTPTSIDLTAGKTTTISATNDGAAKHNLTIEKLKVDVDLPAGSTKTATVEGAKPGTYEFHCEYHPTQMKGTVTVK
ncbi:MAG: cupredoxin domain-containing protein, partial [Acidimicrobiia bacterium]